MDMFGQFMKARMQTNRLLNALGLTQDHRPIRLRVSNLKGISEDVLLVKHVSGVESIFGGIEYSLLCVSTQAGMALKQFIANPVELQFVTDTGGLRSVCGIVAGIAEGHNDGGLATYQLLVRDAFSLLDQTCNTRVFRNVNEVQIIETLLKEWIGTNSVLQRAFDFDLGRVTNKYPAREFTLQHNESTGAFIRRLCKRRGIAWFVQAGSRIPRENDVTPAHTLVFFDDSNSLRRSEQGTMRYHQGSSTASSDSITTWHAERVLTAGSVTRRSFDYKEARCADSQVPGMNDQGPLGNSFAASLDDYLVDVPHAGADAADYRDLAVARIERHEFEAKFFRAESDIRDLFVGQSKRLVGHREIDTHHQEQREFVIAELRVVAENNLPKALDEQVRRMFAINHWRDDSKGLEQASLKRNMRYANRFTCVRRGIPIVAAYDPRIDLPRTALQYVTVVGPVNEEIYCDESGRIKVRFPGTRTEDHAHAQGAGASDSDSDSSWVQVASFWAGAQYGALSLPRAGDLVLCMFVGGDPDKPLIIGRAHGGRTPPPSFSRKSQLPADKYLSGIVSKEGGTYRYNQLRLDDTPGEISAQLSSAHGDSQLNLGYLTHPRQKGRAQARGEGFELSTSDSGAIRTAKALLISAWKRLADAGSQLSSEEHLALMQDCLDLFKSLGQYAAEHQGLPVDPESQVELKADLDAATGGSNIDKDGAGGKPTLSLTAPAGIALSTPKTLVSYAGMNVDSVAQQNMQFTSGQCFNLNAGKGISLFSHTDGIRQIAHNGKFLLQSQHDDVQIDSAKDLKVTAGERMLVMAETEVTIMVSGGAYLTLKGGDIELGGPGTFTVKTNGHHWNGAASAQTDLPKFTAGDFARTPRLLRPTDGKPVEGMQLHVERPGAGPVSGQSNSAGEGAEVKADRIEQIKAFFFKKKP